METRRPNPIPNAQGHVVSNDARTRLSAHLKARGERVVCAALRVSRASLARVLGGLPVRLGTLALVERGLAQLDAERAAEGGVR